MIVGACNYSNKKEQNNFENKEKRIAVDQELIVKDSTALVSYAIEIEEMDCSDNKQDVAVLFFEGGFSNDSVQVFLNNKRLLADKITTDPTLGVAEVVELGKLSNLTDLSITINNSQKMDVLSQACSFTFVNFQNEKVSVHYDTIFVPYN